MMSSTSLTFIDDATKTVFDGDNVLPDVVDSIIDGVHSILELAKKVVDGVEVELVAQEKMMSRDNFFHNDSLDGGSWLFGNQNGTIGNNRSRYLLGLRRLFVDIGMLSLLEWFLRLIFRNHHRGLGRHPPCFRRTTCLVVGDLAG